MTNGEAFERVPFLRALPAAERERLLPYARVVSLEVGEGCWAEGQMSEELVFVLGGRVKLVKSSEGGRETILEIAAPGQLLCGNAVFCFAPYCCAGLAMEATEVLVLPRRDVLALAERDPRVASALVRELADRGMGMCRRVEELAGNPVERRIALLLLKLADRAGVAVAGGIRVPVALSRQDVADLCGTTLETTIRVMSRWKKAGLIRTNGRGLLISDRQALDDLARARALGRSC